MISFTTNAKRADRGARQVPHAVEHRDVSQVLGKVQLVNCFLRNRPDRGRGEPPGQGWKKVHLVGARDFGNRVLYDK